MPQVIASMYEIIQEIGAGGGGVVYLARHLRLDKLIVLKADKRSLTTSPEALKREVNALKNLTHTYLPQVYDFVQENGVVYTVMDYIQGESLDKPLQRGETFPLPQVIEWACELLEALAYLHNRPPHGILHSDIKPANIMVTPDGTIRLIDFNIALILKQEGAVRVGRSHGYASPEHYGVDFTDPDVSASLLGTTYRTTPVTRSVIGRGGTRNTNSTLRNTSPAFRTANSTATSSSRTANSAVTGSSQSVNSAGTGSSRRTGSTTSGQHTVLLDKRSDIYSVGATLYHLLTGTRPEQRAEEVIPASTFPINPVIAAVVEKAMHPNPDLRYQSAEEMLYDLEHLREYDPRTKRHKRRIITAAALTAAVLVCGAALTFTAQEQMKRIQTAYALAEYSADALQKGDVDQAVTYALKALPENRGIFDPPYTPQAQYALAEALGVYDKSDGYKAYRTIALPGQPVKAGLSPAGDAAVTLVQNDGNWQFCIFSPETGEKTVVLPAAQSALSDFAFLNGNILLYAGENGFAACDFHTGQEIWSTGVPATSIALSADGTTAATVFRDNPEAFVWDTASGTLRGKISFGGKSMKVPAHDVFLDPRDNLLALSPDGTWLAVSFSDGALILFNTLSQENYVIYDNSRFTHFEGGFYDSVFAFCSNGAESSLFDIVDMNTLEEIGGFSMTTPFHVRTDETGVYLSSQTTLVKINPFTGEQQEAAYTRADITSFCHAQDRMLVITADHECLIYDSAAQLIQQLDRETDTDSVSLGGAYVLTANGNETALQIHQWKQYDNNNWILSYDPAYVHSQTHIFPSRPSAMLYNYQHFRIVGENQRIVYETDIPDAMEVYSEKYLRDSGPESDPAGKSDPAGESDPAVESDPAAERLEITWNDGTVRTYSAETGELLSQTQGPVPDESMDEEYIAGDFLIRSPLHGDPEIYDRSGEKLIAVLHEDGYLAFATQTGEYLIAEFIRTESNTAALERYGLLLNRQCETLAKLPYLCDILPDGTLIFDDYHGILRQGRIYSTEELIRLAQERLSNK